MSKSLKMKVATQAIIAGLTLASAGIGAGFTASTAFADEPEAAAAQTVPQQNFDFSKDGHASLHIVKLTGDHLSETKDPTGEAVSSTEPEEPLAGAVFQIQRLDYDFHNPDDVATASNLTPEEAAEHISKDPAIPTKKTGTDGTATFEGLKLGAYLVTETVAPDGRVKAKPFIAFVPSTSKDGNSWNYDVYAYPKNTATQVVKKKLSTVKGTEAGKDGKGTTNANANTGDTVYYDVTANRPALDNKKQYFTQFAVYDKYSSALTPKTDVTDDYKLSIGGTSLTFNKDFEVGTKNDNGTEYWYYNLTDSGLKILTKAGDDAKVVATFPFTVGAAADKATGFDDNNVGGVTFSKDKEPNPGTVPSVPKTPDFPTPHPTPNNPESPKTENHWVKVKFKKTDETGKNALAGADFNVYRCTKTDGKVGLDSDTGKAVLTSNPLKVGPTTKFTSGQDGFVTINSLRVYSTDNDKGYCLVETHAPKVDKTQYALLQSPYFFHVTATANKDDSTYTYAFDIADNAIVKDRESNVPKLPATGGVGVGLLMALGIVIVGGGAYYARRNTKAEA